MSNSKNDTPAPANLSVALQRTRVQKALKGVIRPENLYKEERERYDRKVAARKRQQTQKARKAKRREAEKAKRRQRKDAQQPLFDAIADELVREFCSEDEIDAAKKQMANYGGSISGIRQKAQALADGLRLTALKRQDARRKRRKAERKQRELAVTKRWLRLELLCDAQQLIDGLVDDDLVREVAKKTVVIPEVKLEDGDIEWVVVSTEERIEDAVLEAVEIAIDQIEVAGEMAAEIERINCNVTLIATAMMAAEAERKQANAIREAEVDEALIVTSDVLKARQLMKQWVGSEEFTLKSVPRHDRNRAGVLLDSLEDVDAAGDQLAREITLREQRRRPTATPIRPRRAG